VDFPGRIAAGALVAVLGTATLASACGVTVRPTVSTAAAAVLAGRSSAPLILRLQGVKGAGVVRVYVDDGTHAKYAGTSDPRYVGYAAFEGGGVAHDTTVIVSGADALRAASKNGAIKLRFVGDHGTTTVGTAVLDAG
jgi:hypothetical protein